MELLSKYTYTHTQMYAIILPKCPKTMLQASNEINCNHMLVVVVGVVVANFVSRPHLYIYTFVCGYTHIFTMQVNKHLHFYLRQAPTPATTTATIKIAITMSSHWKPDKFELIYFCAHNSNECMLTHIHMHM